MPRFFTGSVEKTSSFEFKNLNNRQIQEKSSALIILVHCHDWYTVWSGCKLLAYKLTASYVVYMLVHHLLVSTVQSAFYVYRKPV